MQIPTKAVVLAAGLGNRLRPMTLATPKPLMPIWNRSFLDHTLDRLASWGVKAVMINTHHLQESLAAWAAAYSGPLQITLTHEPTILGTGGALRPMQHWLGDEPFWMVNGDIAWEAEPQPLLDAFEASNGFAATWLDPKRGPRTVECDFAGRITSYASPTPGIPHTYTLCGLHLLSPAVIGYLPKEQESCSIVAAWEAAMFDNHFVRAAIQPAAYWNDGGTLERYLAIHTETQKAASPYYAHHADLPHPRLKAIAKKLGYEPLDTIYIPMGKRGSQREFWRLVCGKKCAVAIFFSPERPDNTRYAATTRILTDAKVAVPACLAYNATQHEIVLQDLGDDSLESRLNAKPILDEHLPEPTPLDLAPIGTLLAKFHQVTPGRTRLEPPMDADLLRWEHSLYADHCSPFTPAQQTQLDQIVQTLNAQPQVLIHRDCQSSNIIYYKDAPYFIDYQGMRKGPAAYDLASLVYDPYVDYTGAQRETLIAAYCAATGDETIRAILPAAGIQRLIQAIGAFHRLVSVGQTRFAQYIPKAQASLKALGFVN